MNRSRRLLFLALMLAPAIAKAQQLARIAWVGSRSERDMAVILAAFKQGLRENGLIEGKHYVLDARWADGHYERFPEMVDDLLSRKPAVMMVNTIASVRIAQQATKTVPLVMMSTNDPVGVGLISSLARPGGNTTGTTNLTDETIPKLLEFAHILLPKVTRVAVLLNPGNSSHPKFLGELRAVAGPLGLVLQAVELKSVDEVDAVFSVLALQQPEALIELPDAMLGFVRERLAALALLQRLPRFVADAERVGAGALLSYGPSRPEIYRRSASYVKKILDGAKPADLPVEQPTKFELVINLKTAKALGITIPRSLLLRADEVIE